MGEALAYQLPSDPPAEAAEAKALITFIEGRLGSFYAFNPELSANDFLLTDAELSEFCQQHADSTLEPPPRAGVWLLRERHDELFLGLHLSDALRAAISQASPLDRLDSQNLDPFCVVVEEVSHFHLLRQRLSQERSVSRLELEWQGDIDKTLLAASLLLEQAGHAHLHQLVQRIYEDVSFISPSDLTLYREANLYAAKFWQEAIAQGIGEGMSLYDRQFLALLRYNYARPLAEKFPFTGSRRK